MAPTKNHRSKKPSSSDELRPEEREEMDNEEEGMEVLEENGCCESKKCCNESGKKKMQGGKRRLADDEGHEDCSRKSAVEKTSRASESLSRSMIDKWTGAESAMLFEDPLKSAGVAKVQQTEH